MNNSSLPTAAAAAAAAPRQGLGEDGEEVSAKKAEEGCSEGSEGECEVEGRERWSRRRRRGR